MARASRLRVRLRRAAIKALSRTHLALYRASRGRLLGSVAGMPVLLLTTTGRRSLEPRTTPLTFFREGDDLVVIGSNGGADRAPDWLLNLRAHPDAVVAIGSERFPVRATTAAAAERERLWPGITARYAGYADYQERTTRQIPVVLLSPVLDTATGDDAGPSPLS
jgi:deazaflavin-dependent oxidoreductase (nitroreductase family)